MKNVSLTLCAAFALAVPTFASAQNYVFDRNIGNTAGSVKLYSPEGIALDSAGNLYAADVLGGRIVEYSSQGVFQRTFSVLDADNGSLSYPLGVAVDGNGNVYVADSLNYRIVEFASSGAFVKTIGARGKGNGQFGSLADIAVDASGNIYAGDYSNARVAKFDRNGQFVQNIGDLYGDGHIPTLGGLAVDGSGSVYVSDNNSNRIAKFSSSGVFLKNIVGLGFYNDGVYHPKGIAVDKYGNIFATNNLFVTNPVGFFPVKEFDSSGVFVAGIGSVGSGDGQANITDGVVVDASGNVYIADPGNHRVVKFDAVPEPGEFAMLAAGLSGGAFLWRRRKRFLAAKP